MEWHFYSYFSTFQKKKAILLQQSTWKINRTHAKTLNINLKKLRKYRRRFVFGQLLFGAEFHGDKVADAEMSGSIITFINLKKNVII